jgi:predicted O-methyltransferase YrrM
MKDQFYVMRDSNQMKGLEDMIEWVNKIRPTQEMNIIEIGSYTGESTTLFAQHFKQVISVDPFVDGYDPSDEACLYAPFEKVYGQFLKNTLDIPNVKSIRDSSENAFNILNYKKWDMVYIDGAHTLEGVWFDIKNYMTIISPNGFLSGHDYGWGNVRHNIGRLLDDNVDATFVDGSWIKTIK